MTKYDQKRSKKFGVKLCVNNQLAIKEGPKRKRWTKHDLSNIQPMTNAQDDMFLAWFHNKNICAHGSAGTGKTFISLYLALNEIFETNQQQKIIIVRSVVPGRELGHLPGTLEEKITVYELPYHDICHQLIGKASTYQNMKDAGLIEFTTTSFLRGLTWDNAIIIVDEAENLNFHELDSVMTRIGTNSRVIIAGDFRQTDLNGKRSHDTSGILRFLNVVNVMEEFSTITFTTQDIVRSELVKSWITASEKIET
jgi:phosphate starvation-inducible PhoH-like protein